ncbi:unnamed protein product [Sphenostylis stenocarpa]|uniref:DUF4220 domain-containing protein n=1 Tax=Sphenostylis stenocarpa TaxID=92480 RepID=A0AA86SBH3_9FABA|nr:unnamed protein product [Sphenostylis stenocarpa]
MLVTEERDDSDFSTKCEEPLLSLILLGNKRKHCTGTWLIITLWFSYLLAYWLATVSLGVLSNKFVLALYIFFLRAWKDTDLNILAIPIFIASIVKVGERIWVLWSASSQQFKESLFPDTDPGPNYARHMETYIAASHEGFVVMYKASKLPQFLMIILMHRQKLTSSHCHKSTHTDLKLLSFQNGNGKKVFQVMQLDLGFMYDLFYIKTVVTLTLRG